MTAGQATALSIIAVFLYVAILLILSHALSDVPAAYRSLFQWDGHFYASIVNEGYYVRRMPWPIAGNPTQGQTNVAFFPAYPYLALLVSLITFLPADLALLLVSQLSCIILLTYILLLLQRFGFSAAGALVGVLALLSFPAAIFLVASLPESFLLASAAGYLYWSRSDRAAARWLAAGHGIVLTTTKVLALPIVVLPIIPALLRRDRSATLRHAGTAVVSLLGIAGFLLCCQWAFGHWNLYFAVQRAGWGIDPAPLFFLDIHILAALLFPWTIAWPTYVDFAGNPVTLTFSQAGYYAVSAVLWWTLFWPFVEWVTAALIRNSAWRDRAGLYAGAAVSLFLVIAATWNNGLQSATRYLLLPFLLLFLTIAHWSTALPVRRNVAMVILLALCAAAFFIQYDLAGAFLRGEWVG